MSDLDIIIFAIAGVAIILVSLYVVISMTKDINATIHKCKEIEAWAKKRIGKEKRMRIIDADALMDDIKRDSKKAIDEGDKVGSFWLGHAAGLVIKQPTIQSALDSETLIRTIETGITATNSNDAYSLGMRNGMRWCKSLIDGAEPKFEDDATSVDDGIDSAELPTAQPEPQWISCRNDLPDIGMTVLFCDIDGDEFIGHRASDYWWSVDEKVKSVIAWMPLPEPYKPTK